MATCNGGRYLREQLESILMQLGPGDELVVSDDVSSDDTLAILAGTADLRLRVLSGNVFHSPVRNFENALYHARGGILVLSDQDDIWLPGRLELVRQYLAEKVDRIALIMMDGEIVDAADQPIGQTVFERNRAGAGLLKNLYDNTYTGCCLAFTRPLLDVSLPFPAKIPMHDMWLGLLAEIFGEVAFVPVKTMRHRRHGANASFRSTDRLLQVRRRLDLVLSLAGRCARIWRKGMSGTGRHKAHE
jgi:glycosyltransferase involved in cell wall biosynthesis